MTPPLEACAYEGVTVHAREIERARRFAYPIAQIFIDIDRIAETAAAMRHFGYNRAALFAFYDKDHGDRSGAPLRPWAEAMFARGGITLGGGRIFLLCFPRMLGFVFNPISIWFGYGPEGDLRGVLYEVNNTFGEQHVYVAATPAGFPHRHAADKRFHVSPFLDVRGRYAFALQAPAESFRLTVENIADDGRSHVATIVARRKPLDDRWIRRTAARLPAMTMMVVAAIHWEAAKIFARGVRYRRRPPPAAPPFTIAHTLDHLRIDLPTPALSQKATP